MGQRWKFTAEYKPEAVEMFDIPGTPVCQVAADLGIVRICIQAGLCGQRAIRDEEVNPLRRELARITKERDVLGEVAACFVKASKCRVGFDVLPKK